MVYRTGHPSARREKARRNPRDRPSVVRVPEDSVQAELLEFVPLKPQPQRSVPPVVLLLLVDRMLACHFLLFLKPVILISLPPKFEICPIAVGLIYEVEPSPVEKLPGNALADIIGVPATL